MNATNRRLARAIEALEPRRLLATFGVTIFTDTVAGDGQTSLREAITAANANNEDDTINLPAGTYVMSRAGRNEGNNLTGDFDVMNDHKLTIVGAGSGQTTIDANLIDRVFDVRGAASLELRDVTLRNGRLVDFDSGAGIAFGATSADAVLTVTRCVIRNSRAERDAAGAGGGAMVLAGHGEFLISDTLIEGNFGRDGGGVAVTGSARGSFVNCQFTDNLNTPGGSGGGLYNNSSARVRVQRCEFDGNHGGGIGGGAILNTYNLPQQQRPQLVIEDSYIHGNDAAIGGGIRNTAGEIYVYRSTIERNVGFGAGGGIANFSGVAEVHTSSMWLVHCTISGNRMLSSTSTGGAGVLNHAFGAPAELDVLHCTILHNNGLVGGQSRGGGISSAYPGSAVTLSNSAIALNDGGDIGLSNGAPTPALQAAMIGGDPVVGPLKQNGGLGPTYRPLPSSPLLNSANPTYSKDPFTNLTLETDQRGFALTTPAPTLEFDPDVGAVERLEHFRVVRGDDDLHPGFLDGTFPGQQQFDLTLREAVMMASLLDGDETITFAPSITGVIELNPSHGDIPVSGDVTVEGPGMNTLGVDARDAVRHFRFEPIAEGPTSLTLNGITLTHGRADGGAGGSFLVTSGQNQPATLSLTDVQVIGSSASTNGGAMSLRAFTAPVTARLLRVEITDSQANVEGGAIFTESTSAAAPVTVEVRDSTIAQNGAHIGGGIRAGDGVTLLLTNSTISGNTAGAHGGGIDVAAAAVVGLGSCTVTDNTAGAGGGGGVFVGDGVGIAPNLANTVLAGNDAPVNPDFRGEVLNVGGSRIGGDPRLAPLAPNGGPTRTHRPLRGSPLVDAGANALAIDMVSGDPLTRDQRGHPRIADGLGDGIVRVDVGAFELPYLGGRVLVADIQHDEDDGNTAAGDLSIREAIALAGAAEFAGDDEIFLPHPAYAVALGELTVNLPGSVTRFIAGGTTAVVNGNGSSRIFNIAAGSDVHMSKLIVTGGSATTGGGILNAGTLTFADGTIADNTATTSVGGGIRNTGSLTLERTTVANNSGWDGAAVSNTGGVTTIRSSTIRHNTITGGSNGAGAVSHVPGTATGSKLWLVNSTVSTNSGGSGIFFGASTAEPTTARIVNSTILNNADTLSNRGALRNVAPGASIELANTVIAGSTFGDFNGIVAGFVELGGVFLGGREGNPHLGPLASNGGATQTHRPLPGSLLVDAGTNALAVDPQTLQALSSDQRGQQRIRDGNNDATATVDIGAVEATLAETRPVAISSAFAFETWQAVSVRFNGNVFASVNPSDLQVVNTTTNQSFSAQSIAYEAATNTATWILSGPAGLLTDGDYVATLPAASISASGQTLASNETVEFFILAGDANRDRRVNLADFNILAANFGQSPRTFSQGDFTYDGGVNLADFNVLASRFGGVAASGAGDSKDPFEGARAPDLDGTEPKVV